MTNGSETWNDELRAPMSAPQASLFEVDEIINPEDWDLRIQITSPEPLEAVIIKSVPTSKYVRTWAEGFFPVGKLLRFIRTRPEAVTSWRIDTDEPEMPWKGVSASSTIDDAFYRPPRRGKFTVMRRTSHVSRDQPSLSTRPLDGGRRCSAYSGATFHFVVDPSV